MSIALSSKVVHNTVQFVCPLRLILLARNLQHRLDLHDIIDFFEVHLPFAEDEAFQVDD